MFTGLVQGQGRIEAMERRGGDMLFRFHPLFSWDRPKIGESVACNGVCLTMEAWISAGPSFTAFASADTLSCSNLGGLVVGAFVNMERAMAMGAGEIVILGATGGRLDHMIGNIQLLYPCLQKGIRASIIDPQNRLYLIDGETVFRRHEVWGTYISFLPLTQEVTGITLKGFKYPLENKDICIGTSLCISNELIEEEGRITFSEGVLMAVESHD